MPIVSIEVLHNRRDLHFTSVEERLQKIIDMKVYYCYDHKRAEQRRKESREEPELLSPLERVEERGR